MADGTVGFCLQGRNGGFVKVDPLSALEKIQARALFFAQLGEKIVEEIFSRCDGDSIAGEKGEETDDCPWGVRFNVTSTQSVEDDVGRGQKKKSLFPITLAPSNRKKKGLRRLR